MNSQLQTPVLAAHYRVMPGRQQLQEQLNGDSEAAAGQQQQQQQVYPIRSTDGRTFAGFSFNAGFGSGAEMIFYEFAGMMEPLHDGAEHTRWSLLCCFGYDEPPVDGL
jgi:hypothetical protein